jgi:hypothetical protein
MQRVYSRHFQQPAAGSPYSHSPLRPYFPAAARLGLGAPARACARAPVPRVAFVTISILNLCLRAQGRLKPHIHIHPRNPPLTRAYTRSRVRTDTHTGTDTYTHHTSTRSHLRHRPQATRSAGMHRGVRTFHRKPATLGQPRPNAPARAASAAPQAYTVPSSARASVCLSPAITASTRTPCNASTSLGNGQSLFSP